jgi:thioredoxin reductase
MQPGRPAHADFGRGELPRVRAPDPGTDLVTTMRNQAERFGVRYMMEMRSRVDLSGEQKAHADGRALR